MDISIHLMFLLIPCRLLSDCVYTYFNTSHVSINHLGQLWDGSGDVEDIIEEDGQGCVWVGDDEDGKPVIVGFTYEELDQERLMDTVVTVTDIF